MKKVVFLSILLLLLFSCKKKSVKKSCCATPPYVAERWSIYILVPNVFTPDGDGINDTFGPLGDGFIKEEYEMKIINVRDKVVFSTKTGETWDGVYNGKKINDVVGWEITYALENEPSEKITILGQVCVISDTDDICPNYMDDCLFSNQLDGQTFNPDKSHGETLCVE